MKHLMGISDVKKNLVIKNEAPYGYFGCPKYRDIKNEAPCGYFGCPKYMDIKNENFQISCEY